VFPSGPRQAAYGQAIDRAEPSSGQFPDAGTLPGMSQGLASHILAGRRVAAIRGDEPPDAAREGPLAQVLPLPGAFTCPEDADPGPSARLAAPGAVLKVDAQMRICLGPLCGALGWEPGTAVVLALAEDGRVLARCSQAPVSPARRWPACVPVDLTRALSSGALHLMAWHWAAEIMC
jgi:hypothetical protein